jgi:hypothetical protein
VCALLEDLAVVFQERDVSVDRGRRRREDAAGNGVPTPEALGGQLLHTLQRQNRLL